MSLETMFFFCFGSVGRHAFREECVVLPVVCRAALTRFFLSLHVMYRRRGKQPTRTAECSITAPTVKSFLKSYFGCVMKKALLYHERISPEALVEESTPRGAVSYIHLRLYLEHQR